MKSDIDQIKRVIKTRVSSYDFAVFMGWPINRYGRMYECPVCGYKAENKESPGFVVCKDKFNGGYHCFYGSHGGDVIDLCMRTNGLEFFDALRWFNDTFCLHLEDIPQPTDKDVIQVTKDQEIRNALYKLYTRHVRLYCEVMESGQVEKVAEASKCMDEILTMINKLN